MSWIPDFSNFLVWADARMWTYSMYPGRGNAPRTHRCYDKRPEESFEKDFQDTTTKFAYVHSQHQPHHLHVKGRVFARITEAVTVPTIPTSLEGEIESAFDHYSYFEAFQDWYLAWCQWFQAFFDFSVHGFDVHKELTEFLGYPTHWSCHNKSIYTVANDYPVEFWERYAQSRPQGCTLPRESPEFRNAQYFLMLALSECPLVRNRRAWEITVNGRDDLAWLPKDARLGDQICLFAGGLWPFVIRPVGDGTYRLVGDCHTFSTPLIEALGGTYDVDVHGDGHVYSYSWEAVDDGEIGSEGFESGDMEVDQSDDEKAEIEEATPEGLENDIDEEMADRAPPGQVKFRRGECLSFNMSGLCTDEYVEKMDYITLV